MAYSRACCSGFTSNPQAATPTGRCCNQAIPFLRDRLSELDVKSATIVRLISELDSERFDVREKARKQLAKMDAAVPLLRQSLASNPSLELRQRIEALLTEVEDPAADSDRLQSVRCVAVLESIGTPEARQVLGAIARGDSALRRTRDASNALARLSRDR